MEQNVTLQGVEPEHQGAFDLTLTDAAVHMAQVMMQREQVANGVLRVGVSGGGCSGMQYKLNFDDKTQEDDVTLDCGGVRVVVDSYSRPYLNGMTIDYVHALHGAGFKFLNPNAERTCGCGTSFAV